MIMRLVIIATTIIILLFLNCRSYKTHRLVDSIQYNREQQGKCSRLFILNTIYYNFTDSIFSMQSHSYFKKHLKYNNFQFDHIPTTISNFKVTLFLVETIVFVRMASRVFMFIPMHFFDMNMLITTMNAHRIGYYCYCHHQFTVCALQLINNASVHIFNRTFF